MSNIHDTKFFCKTDFDMKEIQKEEAGYVPLPKFYTFPSREERERILYKNFVQVGQGRSEQTRGEVVPDFINASYLSILSILHSPQPTYTKPFL